MPGLRYASTEKPGEPGSWRSGSDFGAGFSRLFVSGVARAFMPGAGRAEPSVFREGSPMSTIYFDTHLGDEERRRRLYSGDVFVYSPRPSTRALSEFARS